MLRLYLFGAPRIVRNGHVVALGHTKSLALLAYLAVTRQPQERERLLGLLWAELDQAAARNNLRRELSQLKRSFGDTLLVSGQQIAWNTQAALWLDVAAFLEQIAAARQLPLQTEAWASVLIGAVELARDDFLAGFSLADSPQFEEWQFFERETLRQQLAEALQGLAGWLRTQGDYSAAIGYARRWLALDGLHEPAHRELMLLYALVGQQAAALRQYEECVRVLERELGVPPEAETTGLFELIRSKRLSAQGAPKVATASPLGSTPTHDSIIHPQLDLPAPAPLRPQTCYVTSGEVHIAYQVIGAGPVDVLIVGGFVSHLEQTWEEPGLVQFLQRLATMARIIQFDKRGVGLSDRVGYPPTLEDTMDDLLAVMDAVGATCPVLFGVSEGGPNSVLFAATYPERTKALILYGAAARFTRAPDYPWALTDEQYDRWLDRLIAGWGGPVSLEYFAPTRAHEAHFQDWWARTLRLSSSPGSVKAVLEIQRDIDVRAILPAISVPTLVLHRAGDRVTRVEGARYLAQRIVDATYVELAGDDHWWWVGETDSLLARVAAFLKTIDHPRLSAPVRMERILATLLLIEFTGGLAAVGDASAAPPEHVRTLVRRQIAHYRGQEIRWSGNRVLAIFDGPSRALHCAVAIRAAGGELGVILRAGLHTGECESANGDLGGVAVEITAAVMGSAAPGAVMVSSTVKDLVLGAPFDFDARGSYALAGSTEAWRLFELRDES